MMSDKIKQAGLDSAKFSNFAQRVKMKYWEKYNLDVFVGEEELDIILSIAWNELKVKNKPQAICPAICPGCKEPFGIARGIPIDGVWVHYDTGCIEKYNKLKGDKK